MASEEENKRIQDHLANLYRRAVRQREEAEYERETLWLALAELGVSEETLREITNNVIEMLKMQRVGLWFG